MASDGSLPFFTRIVEPAGPKATLVDAALFWKDGVGEQWRRSLIRPVPLLRTSVATTRAAQPGSDCASSLTSPFSAILASCLRLKSERSCVAQREALSVSPKKKP